MDSYRPKLHYLCGTNISNLVIVNATADFKTYNSICILNNTQLPLYTPKNKNDISEIIMKYRKRIENFIWWVKFIVLSQERLPFVPGSFTLNLISFTCQSYFIPCIDYQIRFLQTIIESMKQHSIGTVMSWPRDVAALLYKL